MDAIAVACPLCQMNLDLRQKTGRESPRTLSLICLSSISRSLWAWPWISTRNTLGLNNFAFRPKCCCANLVWAKEARHEDRSIYLSLRQQYRGTVDCAKVAETASHYPDVAYVDDPMYTCAEPGQAAIEEAIKKERLDGVVVASCTPRMHEPTFRKTVERAGLNPYMFEMANIREHVSWIGKDKEANTNKAAELVLMAVEKLRHNRPLVPKSFDITKKS